MHKQRFGQLFFCILSVLFLSASAQLFTNGAFDGCTPGAGGAPGSANGWDNSLRSVNAVDAGFTTATTDCVTDFTNAALTTVDASQTVSLVINSNYDFSSQVACIGNTATDQCTFSLTFGGISVGTPLVLNASPAPGAFSVFIVNNIAALTVNTVVSLSVTETGSANGFSTSATLVLAGSGSADPHFVGFNGERFDFVGEAGKTYNLVSDVDVQVNTLLYRQQATKHLTVGGPVMKEIVVSTDDGHVVVVDCGGLEIPESGFISVDGQRLVDGQILTKGKITATFRTMLVLAKNLGLSAEEEEVVSMAHLTIENAYEFTFFFVEYGRNPYHRDQWITIYPRRFLDFSARLLDSSRKPHGILGQTASLSNKARSVGEFSLQGSDKDYEVADGLQGKDFSFNRFL